MATAKDIVLKPITRQEADATVKKHHYSGKVVNNSQFHIGVFLHGRLEGAMQFGPSLDKRKIQGLVEGTPWNGFIELNRMAFSDNLPRNSESRALGVAMRILKKHAPHIQWVISFADGAQCGDGTIYRATGFVLTQINSTSPVRILPNGEKIMRATVTKGAYMLKNGGKASWPIGSMPIPGFQLRYIYFLDPTARERLTVPVLPFSEIEKRGAGMYRGKIKASSSAASIDSDAPVNQTGEGGAEPTAALQFPPDPKEANDGD